jgi:hypothetical protein
MIGVSLIEIEAFILIWILKVPLVLIKIIAKDWVDIRMFPF